MSMYFRGLQGFGVKAFAFDGVCRAVTYDNNLHVLKTDFLGWIRAVTVSAAG